jgi:hypothetical protein
MNNMHGVNNIKNILRAIKRGKIRMFKFLQHTWMVSVASLLRTTAPEV